ncbi:Vacuolar protein sorting-associated protein 11-like protein [Armadillidium vulgare]|nr:Vacuolar protein sorting-associated protein 11-like protein [Armadillidium vulgare]
MGTVLQWRKFNFFDVKTDFDEGKISEVLKDCNIISTGSGRGVIFLGDSDGFVHTINRQLQISSFRAHDGAVKILLAIDNSSLLLTVQDHSNGSSEIKIWSPERKDSQGCPLCLREIKPDPRPFQVSFRGNSHQSSCPSVTAIALHPNNALLAVGFSDGSLMLYRGDVRRERDSKMRIIVSFSSGAITNLHMRHSQKACHLFATTKKNIYCINCTTKDKETSIELDNDGCLPGCSALTDSKHKYELLVARKDAVYSYTTDSRASCYVFEGQKQSLSWFRGYLIIVAKEATTKISPTYLTVYDPLNKLVTLSTVIEGFLGVMGEWGGLYVMVSGPSLWHLAEKDLHSKLEILFKKNQFDIAVKLAKLQCCDQEDVAEILKQYGDWLYENGNTSAAMEQYIKTIPHLEPSYVIKKFLDTQHIDHLTTYLQALHKSGNATCDHTTLMLNCYTRLRDNEKLDNFIKEGDMDCDVDLGIKVCRGAAYYDHAMALASKHGMHHRYISILLEDKKDYQATLKYISTLNFEDAKENVIRYGSSLLQHIPDEMTEFLVTLCTDYKPLGQPIIKEHQKSLNSFLTPEEPIFADPEDLEYLLIGHSEVTIAFLEKVMQFRPLSKNLYTTLFAELLHQYSLAPEGQDQSALEGKIMKMLQNPDISFNRDHALLLCDKHKFYSGKLLLWELAGMFDELLHWFASRGDYSNVVDVCERHGSQNKKLWCTALRVITGGSCDLPPDANLINTVLSKIDELELMPALEVVELITSSPHVTLGQVRDYLLKVVDSHSSSLNAERSLTENNKSETERLKNSIKSITTDTIEFTGKKCNVCNNNLDLPSIHFLCKHSFHIHCFESYSENESDCPVCLVENKKLRETLSLQERKTSRQEVLQEQLENAPECFTVVADYVGKGVFSNYNTLASFNPSPNTTKDVESVTSVDKENKLFSSVFSEAHAKSLEPKGFTNPKVPQSESRIRVLERVGKGPGGTTGEGRLRLNEQKHQELPSSASEGRLRQSQTPDPSIHSVTTSDGRLRISDKRTPSSSTKIEGRHSFSVRQSTSAKDIVKTESISASLSNPSFSQKYLTKKTDNPFEEGHTVVNPFSDDFETEESETNPFAERYDDSKNPFAEARFVRVTQK